MWYDYWSNTGWSECSYGDVFQQGNAPGKIISNWILEHDGEFIIFKWPSQSTDVNPEEHL